MTQARKRSPGLLGRLFGAKAQQPPKAEFIPVRVNSRDFVRSRPLDVREHGFDEPLMFAVLAMVLWGLVMVYSATIALPDSPRFANYSASHFLIRHLVAMFIGLVAGVLAFQVPMVKWEKHANNLFVMALVLLVLVLIPFIGKGVNGAQRWISLGVLNFQPSELAKLAVVLYASS